MQIYIKTPISAKSIIVISPLFRNNDPKDFSQKIDFNTKFSKTFSQFWAINI